jgi:transcriptional regulator with XRE-family HTH domain
MPTKNRGRIDPMDKEIGQRIRARRLMLSMSQEQLGEKIGVTFQQVQKYEKGDNRVSGSRLRKVAEVLNVRPAFFLDDVETEPIGDDRGKNRNANHNGKGSSLELFALIDRADTVRLLRALKHVPAKQRAAIIELVEACQSGNCE